MYWVEGKFLVLRRVDHVELADQVILPIALAIVVAFAVLPRNLVAAVELEVVAGFIES